MLKWNQIVRKHGPPAFQTAWRILHHTQDCEDVMQEVFIEAHKLYESGEVTYWPTFLQRLATFRAIDSLRRRKANEPLAERPIVDATPSPAQVLSCQEQAIWIRKLVTELPDRQAAVFYLVHFDELSHDEVARTLDISLNAVALALHKARKSLREKIAVQHKEHQS